MTSSYKTRIEPATVLSCLQSNFDQAVTTIDFISGGESSQAFSFQSDNRNYVIRVNKADRPFRKDSYAHTHFLDPKIPIPEVVKIDRLNENYFYCISLKAIGKTLNHLTPEEYQSTTPSLLTTLKSIKATDIGETTGYGKWNSQGVGEFTSWQEFILAVGIHVDSGELFRKSFLEEDVWKTIFGPMRTLSEKCPTERCLVHGDFGADNIVTENGMVTGVLDWSESLYGDFLFDVVWLSFWSHHNDPNQIAEQEYRSMGLPNFEERLLCYKLRIGLSSLSFYAFSNQKEKYESVKAKTLQLLKP